MLKYYYITNRPEVAEIADNNGVQRIFVDMEYIGKDKRQPMDTVKNHHTVEDVRKVRKAVKNNELLVRINPLYSDTKDEIEAVVDAGADIIMLPMWNTADDVEAVLNLINKRTRLIPLLETQSAADALDNVLRLDCIDEIHIGLNDLSISQHKKFLFQPLVDGTVDAFANKILLSGKSFGVGGVGAVGNKVALPAENILAEHYRLKSNAVILSRAFCSAENYESISAFEADFVKRINANREYENMLSSADGEFLIGMHSKTKQIISELVK